MGKQKLTIIDDLESMIYCLFAYAMVIAGKGYQLPWTGLNSHVTVNLKNALALGNFELLGLNDMKHKSLQPLFHLLSRMMSALSNSNQNSMDGSPNPKSLYLQLQSMLSNARQ